MNFLWIYILTVWLAFGNICVYQIVGFWPHDSFIFAGPSNSRLDKIEESISRQAEDLSKVASLLEAKTVQKYSFSVAKTGRSTAVNVVLQALGIVGLVPGELPPRWTRKLSGKVYSSFSGWEGQAKFDEEATSPALLQHLHSELQKFGVPLDVRDGFQFLDVRKQNELSFKHCSDSGELIFSGTTDAGAQLLAIVLNSDHLWVCNSNVFV